MSITNELDNLWEELKQRQLANKAKAELQTAREEILNHHAELTRLSQDAQFDTIPVEIKQVLVKAFNVVKAAKQGFEDSEIAELLDWRP